MKEALQKWGKYGIEFSMTMGIHGFSDPAEVDFYLYSDLHRGIVCTTLIPNAPPRSELGWKPHWKNSFYIGSDKSPAPGHVTILRSEVSVQELRDILLYFNKLSFVYAQHWTKVRQEIEEGESEITNMFKQAIESLADPSEEK